jgi:hypothetical protein
MLLPVVLFASVAGAGAGAGATEVTAYVDSAGLCTIMEGWGGVEGAAYGSLTYALDEEGWDELTVTTNPAKEDGAQMFGAGCVEGFLTAAQIADFRFNFGAVIFGEGNGSASVPAVLADWLIEQHEWAKVHAGPFAASSADPRMRHLGQILKQLDGLHAGVMIAGPPSPITMLDLMLVNAAGDTDDLLGVRSVLPRLLF